VEGVIECISSRCETSVASFKQTAHVCRDKSIRQSCRGTFAPNIAQVETVCGIEIDDAIIAGPGANSRLPNRILKSDEFHRKLMASRKTTTPMSLLLRQGNCLFQL
jgi:hypothetical protein